MLHHTTPAPASPPGAARVPIRSQRPAHWAWFDHALIDDHAQHLGPIGVALYVALARYANHHTGQCWPSLVRLSRQLGITRLTARRYLQRLADHGLIGFEERAGHAFLVTLLALPPGPQTCLPGKQVEETPCVPRTQGDVHAVNTPCLLGKHEPEIPNQQTRTSVRRVAPDQGAQGRTAPVGTEALATQSTLRDTDLAAAFAQLPAAVQEELYTAATARLRAQGVQPAFCIRPVVLSEVFRSLQDAPRSTPPEAPPPGPQAAAAPPAPLPPPAAPASPPPAAALGPPTLRHVTLEDLRDVGRVLALREQAQARGWITGSEADRRWEVLTQEDEETARGWLREDLSSPAHRAEPEAAMAPPAHTVALSDDARFVDRVQRVLPRAWQDTPFLAVKLQCPDWTPARWEQAQAELTQWRLQQAQANPRSPLASLAALLAVEEPWENAEDAE